VTDTEETERDQYRKPQRMTTDEKLEEIRRMNAWLRSGLKEEQPQ
jgi:hypothetical protein